MSPMKLTVQLMKLIAQLMKVTAQYKFMKAAAISNILEFLL